MSLTMRASIILDRTLGFFPALNMSRIPSLLRLEKGTVAYLWGLFVTCRLLRESTRAKPHIRSV